ncbi:hypothetical protein ACQ86B_28615 (plasmid) [Mycolicibacterium aichiense]|uniref:hypothetical protein n=1 Tax=Mycolicibacterium aichiense TaxID=1799 RepID=UPI003D673013
MTERHSSDFDEHDDPVALPQRPAAGREEAASDPHSLRSPGDEFPRRQRCSTRASGRARRRPSR